MNYLQRKKLAFMSIVNKVKGFIREASGIPPLLLEDCVDSDSLIDWKLYGNSVQDGEPTPEAPVEVVSVGEYDSETGKYKVPVVARGKNLFDINNFIEVYSPYMRTALEYGYHAEVNEECLKIYGGIDTDGRALFYMDGSFKENTVYTFSFDCYDALVNNAAGIYICLSYTDGTKDIVNHSRQDKVWKHFSVNSNSSKTVKGITLTYGTGSAYSYLKNIQLEKGSTATDYEPYHEPITTNIYLDEPLRAQYHLREKRWYYDEIDFKTNILIRNLSEKTFVGTANENWKFSQETDSKIHFYIGGISNNCSFGGTLESAMCDKFVGSYTNATTSNSLEGFSVAYTTSMAYIGIFKSRLTDAGLTVDLDGFKTWLSQNPVTITYILKESTEENISIPKLPTIKGTTIYEIGTSLNASNMEATYYSTSKGG